MKNEFSFDRFALILVLISVTVAADSLADEAATPVGPSKDAGLWRQTGRFERLWLLNPEASVVRREVMETESLICRVSRPRLLTPPVSGVREAVSLGDIKVEIVAALHNDGSSRPDFVTSASKGLLEIENGDRTSEYRVVRHYSWSSPSLPYWYEEVHFVRLGQCPSDMQLGETKKISCKITGAVDWSCK